MTMREPTIAAKPEYEIFKELLILWMSTNTDKYKKREQSLAMDHPDIVARWKTWIATYSSCKDARSTRRRILDDESIKPILFPNRVL